MSYLLRFRLHSDAPDDIKKRYNKVHTDIVGKEIVGDCLDTWIRYLERDGIGSKCDRQLLKRS